MRGIRIFTLLVLTITFLFSCKGPEKEISIKSLYPYDKQVFTTNKIELSFNVDEIKSGLSVNVRVNGNLVYNKPLLSTNTANVELNKPTNNISIDIFDESGNKVLSKEVTVFYNKPEAVSKKLKKVTVKSVKVKKTKYELAAKKLEEEIKANVEQPKIEEVKQSIFISSIELEIKDDLGLNTFKDSVVLKYIVNVNEEFKNKAIFDIIKSIAIEVSDPAGNAVFSESLKEPQATFEINTKNISTGAYILTVRAVDTNGRPYESSKWINIDKTPPSVSISAISNNSIIRDASSFSVEAKDDVGVSDVYSTIDDKKMEYTKKGNIYIFSFNSRSYPNGKHVISVCAKDKLGNEVKTNFNVLIDNWLEYTVDSDLGAGFHIASFLDESGGIHLAYYNSSKKSLFYAYNGGNLTNWKIQLVDSQPDSGKYPSIYVDNFSRIHIAYTYINEKWDDEDLRYALFEGSNWIIKTLDEQDKAGRYTGIVVDNKGIPHISYYNYTVGSLRYMTYNLKMNRWEATVPDSYENVGSDTSIDIDTNNVVHIVYLDNANGDLKHCYKGIGEADVHWKFEIIDNEGKVGYYAKMKIDKDNNIHVVYYDSTHKALKYAVKRGEKWTISTIDKNDDPGRFNSIFIDSNNNIHISYFVEQNKEIRYARYDGKTWKIETVIKGRAGGYSSIIFTNRPIIFFYDESSGSLKLVTK